MYAPTCISTSVSRSVYMTFFDLVERKGTTMSAYLRKLIIEEINNDLLRDLKAAEEKKDDQGQ